MDTFELREKESGFELSGNRLEKPMFYPEKEGAILLVGFLSRRMGCELSIYGRDGECKSKHVREPTLPLKKKTRGQRSNVHRRYKRAA
jgi:hypothetical protein